MKHILLTTIAALVLVGCGESPKDIWEAAEAGNIEAVKQYLAAGTDVNAKDGETGITPLHVATDRGRKEVVELLIAAGADVNAKYAGGHTPLHNAAIHGHEEIVEMLITKNTDVNAETEEGVTSLYISVVKGHKKIVELLIAAGADVNAKDEDGETSLDAAIASIENSPPQVITAKEEIADLLRKHGGKTAEELKAEGK